ncbi:MAG: NUDIX domain-containing protein [Ilumatobacteraceae bacterium]
MSGATFDPAAVAIRPAATVMLVRESDGTGIEVFMMRRTTKAAFAGGMYVFPGGAVDAEDSSHEVAAIRECFEEAGVLLARSADGSIVRLDDPLVHDRFSIYRHAVHSGERSMTSVLDAENLTAMVDQMHWVSHWVTPFGEVRRFDTRFFVAAMPPDQEPLHDDLETVDSLWVTPGEALSRARRGELMMLPPTIVNLGFLADHRTVDGILSSVVGLGMPEKILPKVRWAADGSIEALLMPGDPGYEDLPDR